LLAYLMIPNVMINQMSGKIIFVLLDMLVGLLILSILELKGVQHSQALMNATIWLLNPFAINMSTRGSCEALNCSIVLGVVYALFRKQLDVAAVLFGVVVHLRIYPVIYTLPVLFFVSSSMFDTNNTSQIKGVVRCLRFGIISAGVFFVLGIAFLKMYGQNFVHETYLHHITRRDTRHNFSVYFYYLYLQDSTPISIYGEKVQSLIAFLPQLLVIGLIGIKYRQDLTFAMFGQTVAFVAFNKVVTAQYFLWYLCLLPLILPFSKMDIWRGVQLTGAFILAEIMWGAAAFLVEFQGLPAFVPIWMTGLMFFAVQIWILRQFIMHRNPLQNSAKSYLKQE